jgi:hypothetical protein
MRNQCVVHREKKNVLERLRKKAWPQEILIWNKRSIVTNSWVGKKFFPSGTPKCGVRLLNILYVHGIVRNREAGRKVTSFYVPFLSLFLSFFFFVLSSFLSVLVCFSFSSFFRSCHHPSTTHDITSNHSLPCALPHRTIGPCTSSDRYRTVWQPVACLHSTLCGLILSLTVCAIDLWP